MDILIFDDDPYAAGMARTLLTELGYTSEAFHEATNALDVIRRAKPRLVLLDIMMPGCDGLSLCSRIKGQAETAGTAVIIASGKSFGQEKAEALRLGAAAFLEKPYSVASIREAVRKVLGAPEPHAVADAPARPPAFKARVLGSRGPGKPGLPTCCLWVPLEGKSIVLDAGSGLLSLRGKAELLGREVWVLLSHYHDDHLEGLSVLAEAAAKGASISIAGPSDTQSPLAQVVRSRIPDLAGGRIRLFDLSENWMGLGPDVRVATMLTYHPGATMAFKVVLQGHSLVYCPDNELRPERDEQTDYLEKFSAFVRGTDLLVHDARFLDEASAGSMRGHSWPGVIAELAGREGVRALMLFHMDARYDDAALDAALAAARAELFREFAGLRVTMARPGDEAAF
ncbi:MAG: response regulator [Elusimicrobia bacterium]|nr:response regulator [Elusimicrobiota bacterium]